MKTMKRLTRDFAAPLIALTALLFAPTVRAGDHATQQGAAILERIEATAVDVRNQAARLQSYLRNPTMHSWEIHADELNRMDAGLDSISDRLGELKAIRDDVSHSQRAAFNRVVTASTELSTHIEEAVEILNSQRAKVVVGHPDYDKHVQEAYGLADEMVAAADSAEEWRDFLSDWTSDD